MWRHRFANQRRTFRISADGLGNDSLQRRTRERRLAGEHFVQHRAKGVDVAARVDGPFTHRLFGRHVLRRAEAQAGLRQPRAADALYGERNAEVGNERVAALQQDVLGLDVAMDDAEGMRGAEGVGHFARNQQRGLDGQLLLALQSRAQRFASDERHHVIQQPVGGTTIEQRQNVRVLQARGGLDLAQKAPTAERRAQVGVQHLDGHITIVLEIVREVHGGHATGAEFAVDAVAVGQRSGEALRRQTHAEPLGPAALKGKFKPSICGPTGWSASVSTRQRPPGPSGPRHPAIRLPPPDHPHYPGRESPPRNLIWPL